VVEQSSLSRRASPRSRRWRSAAGNELAAYAATRGSVTVLARSDAGGSGWAEVDGGRPASTPLPSSSLPFKADQPQISVDVDGGVCQPVCGRSRAAMRGFVTALAGSSAGGSRSKRERPRCSVVGRWCGAWVGGVVAGQPACVCAWKLSWFLNGRFRFVASVLLIQLGLNAGGYLYCSKDYALWHWTSLCMCNIWALLCCGQCSGSDGWVSWTSFHKLAEVHHLLLPQADIWYLPISLIDGTLNKYIQVSVRNNGWLN
jgi:hypothetical protein